MGILKTKIRNVFQKAKSVTGTNSWYKRYYRDPLDEKAVLLEAGQGKNIHGNMFGLLRELMTDPEWKDLTIYWIIVPDTAEAMKKKLAFYGYEGVRLVLRDTKEYVRILSTAKYLITDNSFPAKFVKKEGQVYLNTWHGTPLKTLGICSIRESTSIANVQKNYMMSDYALFQNAYTRDIFMDDYSLANIMQGKILLCDYPRNDSFADKGLYDTIRSRFRLEGKRIYAYLPTWRGASRKADVENQKRITYQYLKDIDDLLGEDELLYVNLHFLIGNSLDLSGLKHVRMFPGEYETYDFLGIVDALITDYSSVFFDFAVTGRRIVLFTYDLHEYMSTRATYFPVEDLPFPRTDNVKELVELLRQEDGADYEEFRKTYCPYFDGKASREVLRLLIRQDPGKLHIEDAPWNGKENVLVHVSSISNDFQIALLNRYLTECLEKEPDKNYFIFFNGSINKKKAEMVEQRPKGVQILAYTVGFSFTLGQYLYNRLNILRYRGIQATSESLRFEGDKILQGCRMHQIRNFFDTSYYMPEIIAQLPAETEYIRIPDEYYGLVTTRRYFLANHALMEQTYRKTISWSADVQIEDVMDRFYNTSIAIKVRNIQLIPGQDAFRIRMRYRQRNILPENVDKVEVRVGNTLVYDTDQQYAAGRSSSHTLEITIPKEDLKKVELSSFIELAGKVGEKGFVKRLTLPKLRIFKQLVHPEENSTAYLNAVGRTKEVRLLFRERNMSDSFGMNVRIILAWLLAKVYKPGDIILMYEKKSARYEESASVLYENLIDQGYRNVWYIIDKDSEDVQRIPEKYRKNLIWKMSFRHCWYFFACKKFIGTEMLAHAFEVRPFNTLVLRKLNERDKTYVFLQHGVMYMISLDSGSRNFFRVGDKYDNYAVVVSSKLERDHFVDLGGYDMEQVLISGLPKFDRNRWNEGADRIVIMPTWRAWEYNQARIDFTQTKYYQFISRIFYAIPEEYRDKITILPHPLVFDIIRDTQTELSPWMELDTQYNSILEDTKLLITDYSSIAYDAFYRGANVIFCWEELQYALENYGENAKLMLNETNVFGDVCYDTDTIREAFLKNYTDGQQEKYIRRYSRIVEFHDGKNTERLIALLKRKSVL